MLNEIFRSKRLEFVSERVFPEQDLIRFMEEHHATPGRVVGPSRFSVTGRVASTKAETSQDAESTLEQDFFTLLEFDSRVHRYFPQPLTIEWEDRDGRARRYTPDALVLYSFSACKDEGFRPTLFEVKPRAVLREQWRELKPRLKAGIGWARRYDARFHIVTEREIRTPYLENVKFLIGFRSEFLDERPDLIAARQLLIRETLFRLKRSTPREVLEAISPCEHFQAEIVPWLWNLIVCNAIGVDLDTKMTMISPIWTRDTEASLERIR